MKDSTKKTFLSIALTLFIATSFISCEKNVLLPQNESNHSSVAHSNEGLIAYPKKQKVRNRSIESTWDDWTKVQLASGDSVYVPWNNKYVSTAIPVDIRQDVKSRSGWELIAHTVNGYGESGMNYLIFHNKYTGILKVFYYLESGNSALQNTAIWKLHFEVPQSCLAFSESYARLCTDKDISDIYLGNITNDDSKGYTIGWNCFQTELAYDPDLTSGTLQIIPSSMTTSKVELEGSIETETKGLIISATSSNIMNGAVKSKAVFAGKEAEDWVQKVVSKGVFKKISALVIKGAGSLVASGINSLLGSFIGGFNKEQQTTQSVQLKTNGTLTLEGNIKTLESGIIAPLSLSISPSDIGRLGVWCLKEKPVLGLDPYAIHVKQDPLSPAVQFYKFPSPNLYSLLDNQYIINPDLLPYIKRNECRIKGEIYETTEVVLKDALKQGNKGSYCYTQPPLTSQSHLYDKIYLPHRELWSGIRLKDKNGILLENFENNAPIEVYVPTNFNGEPGANPNFTFNSSYFLVVSMELVVEQDGEENTIVLTHSFIPDIIWNKESSPGWYYYVYPFVPIE